jgi:hypothetical protein
MPRASFLFLLPALLLVPLQSMAATLSLTDGGLVVDAGSMGKFTLDYPRILRSGGAQPLPPVEARAQGKQALLKYEGGTEITATLSDAETVTLDLRKLPANVTHLRMDTLIDFGFSEGGTYQIGGGDAKPFPKEKPERPFLYQGNDTTFRLTSFEGKSLMFEVPAYSFQQLQDNREWGWKIYAWMFMAPCTATTTRCTLKVREIVPEGGAKRVIVADRFGQDAQMNFPGKVTSEEELKQDVARDAEYYGSLHPPVLDSYGGLPGSGQRYGLKATGFFHVEKQDKRWLLVDPEGNAVFHLGVCAFGPGDDYTYIKGREQIYEWLPDYDGPYHTAFHPEAYWSRNTVSFYLANVIRKYGKPYEREEWMARTIDRVRKWGFNGGGAFSSATEAHRKSNFPYVSSLPLSEWQLGGVIPGLRGFFDPFDAKTLAKMDSLFAQSIKPQADNPLIIGYFLANEQAFEDIPKVIPTLKGTQPAKLRLVQMLQDKYGTIDKFNQAWGASAVSFDALKDAGLAVATQEAAADMQAYTELFIREHYRQITDAFHRYDRNHLLLGSRWQPGTANSEALCRIAGEYMDVISVNYYTYGLDKSFLNRLDFWAGDKPMMLSEFHWASPSDSGLPGGSEVRSQQERGLAYRNYVEQAASLPYIVGIEWFTLIDQARTGRWFQMYTGEKINTGLLSVTDRPHRDCLAEMMKTNYDLYSVLFGQRAPFVYDDPRFTMAGRGTRTVKIPRAEGPIQLDGRRDGWPGVPPERISGKQMVLGADAGGVEGVFRLCWDDANLYLMVDVTDSTPMQNSHKGDALWSGDGVELFLGSEQVAQPGALLFTDRQILLSAGLTDGAPGWYYAHSPKQYDCKLAVIPRVDKSGYVLEAAIPFAALGFSPEDGKELRFDLAIDDSADGDKRVRQLMWNGGARNSGDRTDWGRAVLTK